MIGRWETYINNCPRLFNASFNSWSGDFILSKNCRSRTNWTSADYIFHPLNTFNGGTLHSVSITQHICSRKGNNKFQQCVGRELYEVVTHPHAAAPKHQLFHNNMSCFSFLIDDHTVFKSHNARRHGFINPEPTNVPQPTDDCNPLSRIKSWSFNSSAHTYAETDG